MIEQDLEKLAQGAPAPRDAAKRQALGAAMQAYEQSAQEKHHTAQGSAAGRRLIHIATSIWSGLMKQRYLAGSILATLMILPAAAYMTWQIVQDQQGWRPEDSAALDAGTRTGPEKAAKSPLQSDLEQRDRALTDTAPDAMIHVAPAEMAPVPQPSDTPVAKRAMKPAGALSQQSTGPAVSGLARQDFAVQADQHSLQPSAMPEAEAEQGRVQSFESNGVTPVAEEPVSTFSADVDTASYALMRQALRQGYLPDPQTVRVEELVNYFPYGYPGPDTAETPFRATVTVTPTPWNENTKLLHVGVKGYDIAPVERPRANLVFLIDVSGSMNAADKLPLLKSAFRLLLNTLEPDDTVSIVTYAGEAGTVLEPIRVAEKQEILDAMERLRPGGSTAGARGLQEAYRLAEKGFVKNGVNRVMLATDGDFNVGPSDDEALKSMIAAKRAGGVFLSVFGFGQGNYNDQLMQTIAQNGNGVAAYIDTLSEAEKTLVQEASASLFPIASDVKFQLEFNPAVVAEYRQIGFETRALKREDFNNDRVDAGEIGSGHTVTAIYEITPVGSPAVLTSDLRYGEAKPAPAPGAESGHGDEYAFLRIRAKAPGEAQSKLTEIPATMKNEVSDFNSASEDVRFSIAVAAFGQKLRKVDAVASYSYDAIEQIASEARGTDPFGYRSEFLQLVRLAERLGQ
ncbi:VWA domain-containing protein [Hoeflea sp. YIM 152468]|uniref:vWA domain-containing protein n=1 Tax=Hoeflea sp. YIM 152468 TaxID=3031759 RepID=UPI0023DA151D|nr:VWA domain-containing protein [Hoeflea sp. YIM 152468]MDF1607611.1 VWA domain-containing protein [Hoeflea sp. YIM 152468]